MTNYNAGKPGDAGFSLVEILVVLAMAVILSAFAVPALNNAMRDMQALAEARNIASTLNHARLKATSLMTPYRVSFDLANNQWRLERFNDATDSFQLQQDVNELSRGLAGSGIAFKTKSETNPGSFPEDSSSVITFNSLGIPVNASNIPTSNNIIYLSRGETDYAITVSLTGNVDVWRTEKDQWESLEAKTSSYSASY